MFHSFNNENSTPLDDPLKFMIDTDDLMKGMPGRTIVDALVITQSKDKLKKVTLKNMKIRGTIYK